MNYRLQYAVEEALRTAGKCFFLVLGLHLVRRVVETVNEHRGMYQDVSEDLHHLKERLQQLERLAVEREPEEAKAS